MKRILIVDSDEDILWTLKNNLTRDIPNIEILDAQSGEKAHEILIEKRIHLVITDIQLPGGMDGFDLLKIINDNFPDTSVIAMTANPTEDDKDEAMLTGCLRFLEKPFDVSELKSVIAKVLNKNSKFQGNIGGISLVDVIQLNTFSGASSALKVRSLEHDAMIFFKNGQIVHAMCDHLVGEEAFFAISNFKGGSLQCIEDAEAPAITIQKDTQTLLFEVAVQSDEESAGGDMGSEDGGDDDDFGEMPDSIAALSDEPLAALSDAPSPALEPIAALSEPIAALSDAPNPAFEPIAGVGGVSKSSSEPIAALSDAPNPAFEPIAGVGGVSKSSSEPIAALSDAPNPAFEPIAGVGGVSKSSSEPIAALSDAPNPAFEPIAGVGGISKSASEPIAALSDPVIPEFFAERDMMDLASIQNTLQKFKEIKGVHTASLMHSSGSIIESLTAKHIDEDNLRNIAHTAFQSSQKIAQNLDNATFGTMFLEYNDEIVLFSPVTPEISLVIISNQKANIGWIRISIKKNTARLLAASTI